MSPTIAWSLGTAVMAVVAGMINQEMVKKMLIMKHLNF